MIREEPVNVETKEYPFVISKIKDYALLMKPNISMMVVFSSVIGYLMVPGISFSWAPVIFLFIGGMLVTNGANIINQIIERYSDRFMARTRIRPLPCGRMSITEAVLIIVASTAFGIFILWHSFNWQAALLSFISLIIYGFIYTPLKKIHPIAAFVGAVSGALPPLIGWVAAVGSFDPSVLVGGILLFTIQLLWQFPHVWSFSWLDYDDYKSAGINMLPSKMGKTSFTGLQCIYFSLPLIPLMMMANKMQMTGKIGMWVGIVCSVAYVFNAFMFFKKNNKKTAKRLFYSSLIYLPVVLLALVIDKI